MIVFTSFEKGSYEQNPIRKNVQERLLNKRGGGILGFLHQKCCLWSTRQNRKYKVSVDFNVTTSLGEEFQSWKSSLEEFQDPQ